MGLYTDGYSKVTGTRITGIMGYTNKDEHQHVFDYETDMFTGITTFHGLVRIYNSKQWYGRIFWITIVIAAFSVFCVQVKQ